MTDKKKEIPDLSHTQRSRIPEKYTWKIDDLYSDLNDWKRDRSLLQQMIKKIEDLSTGWTTSAKKMYRLLNHTSQIEKKANKIYSFASLHSDTDLSDTIYQELKGEMHTILVNLQSLLSFLEPDILKLGNNKINDYLGVESGLREYRMFFDSILRMKKHILSADKEKIVSLTGMFSGSSGKAAGILNDVDLPAPQVTLSNGKKVKLNWATYEHYRGAENRNDRKKVIRTFWKHHDQFKNTFAILQDASVKSHFFYARVHQFKSCLEAALYPKKINADVYHTLIHTVKGNLEPLHRYLKLKARLLDQKKLSYDDIYASSIPSVEETYPIDEAKKLILSALNPLGKEYINVLNKGLNNQWMDIYPNKGKRSGAYSNGSIYDVHPFVLMNFNGKYESVSTLAHEFGHALHSYFSNKIQPFPMAQYPIFLAEIASTFNETLLVNYLIKAERDEMVKLYILDQYLERVRGSLFRQTIFAEFELAMHEHIEKGKTLTHHWLNNNYLELTRLYYGHNKGVCEVHDYIQNEWSAIPHFYFNFYVYQYSTGIVASTALAERVLNGGKAERTKYLDFLKKGGSQYPLDILKEADVDLTTPQPIEATIKIFDNTVSQMEKILKKIKKPIGSFSV